MERFKSPTIDEDRHLLMVMAYVDLNGVRAGRDRHPEESEWSSYRYYSFGRPDSLLLPAPSYLALADEPRKRQIEYQNIVRGIMLATQNSA